MVDIGQMNTLKVSREVEHGYYLEGDDQWGDILLPRKLAQPELAVGDEIEVASFDDGVSKHHLQ